MQANLSFPPDVIDRVMSEPFNFIAYMDTDSMFIKLHNFVGKGNDDTTIKKIYDLCEELETFVNKDAIGAYAKLHNIHDESCTLSFKQEVIARKALFFGVKKKYVLEIIDKERNRLKQSEYDIKGLEIRRSDYPQISKDVMNKMLDMILKEDKELPEILDFLRAERKRVLEVLRSGSLTAARPVSYGKAKYDTNVGHIKGMENWNYLFSDVFHQGSKGYMFYTKGINFSKASDSLKKRYEQFLKDEPKQTGKKPTLTQIVVPDTEQSLPDSIIIDEEKMLDLVFDKRVLVLLAPFGLESINWKTENSTVLSW